MTQQLIAKPSFYYGIYVVVPFELKSRQIYTELFHSTTGLHKSNKAELALSLRLFAQNNISTG